MKKIIGKITGFLYVAAIVTVSVIFTIRDADRNIIRTVTIEAGDEIRIADFFRECPKDAKFVTPVSGIDTSVPAIYKLTVFYDEAFKKDVVLKIEDHTGPKGIAIPKKQWARVKWPEAKDCVGYLYDLNGIAKIEYQNGTPDYEISGLYMVPVVVTDWYNNSAVIDVPFEVTDDHNAPLFYGIHDINIDNSENAVINYFDGVTWKDDFDEEPRVIVDNKNVEIGVEGSYLITYKAVDAAGNIRTQDAFVNIKEPNVINSVLGAGAAWDSNEHNEIVRIASGVLDSLKGSSDSETAKNIFDWVHSHVTYEQIFGVQTYEGAVYQALTKHSGDCYGFYACSKFLLDLAVIPNMMVVSYPVTYQGHYWNLVKIDGEWYHCDSTMFMNHPTVYFKNTDSQIGDSRHRFDGSMLPVRAGGNPEYA